VPLACVPPFESVCALSMAGLVVSLMALRSLHTPAGADPAAKPNGFTPRNLLLACLYLLFVTALAAAVLALGLALGIWGV
jgi:hypothetical protein